MGCVQGKQFVSSRIKGQGPSVLDVAKKLRLNKFQLDGFYNHFCKMDIDGDYKVEIEEFLIVNDIKSMYFGELVFRLFDSDKSGSLDFEEYVVAMWNFCTLDKHALIAFAFNLFDVDSSGTLSRSELTCIIDIIHGYKQTDRLNVALKKLEGTGNVDLKQFIDFSRELPVLLFPAFEIQDRLRSSLFGITRWNGITDDRRKAFGQASVFEILGRETKYADKAIELLIKRVPEDHIDKVRQVTTVMRRKSLNASRCSSLASSLGSIEGRRKSIGGSVHGDEDEDEHDVVNESSKEKETAVALNTLLNAQLGKVAAAADKNKPISASRDNSFNTQGVSKRDQYQQRSVQLQEKDTSNKTSVSLNNRGGRHQPDVASHMKTPTNSPTKDKSNNDSSSTANINNSKSVSISISASLNRDKILQPSATSSSALSAKFLDEKQRKRSRHSSSMMTSFAELPTEYRDTSAAAYIMNKSTKSNQSQNNRQQSRGLQNDASISSINTYSTINTTNNNNNNNNNKPNKKSEKSMKSTTSNASTNNNISRQYQRRKSKDDSEFLYNYEEIQRFSNDSSNNSLNNNNNMINITKHYHSDRDMLKSSNKLINKNSENNNNNNNNNNKSSSLITHFTLDETATAAANNNQDSYSPLSSPSPSGLQQQQQQSRKITSNRFHERSAERRSINSESNNNYNNDINNTTSSPQPIPSARLENVKPFSSSSNNNNNNSNNNNIKRSNSSSNNNNNNGWTNDSSDENNYNSDDNNNNNNKNQNNRRNQRENNNSNSNDNNNSDNVSNSSNNKKPASMKRKKSSVTAPLPPLKLKSSLNLNINENTNNNINAKSNMNTVGSSTAVPSSARLVIESARGLINRFMITNNINGSNSSNRIKGSQIAPSVA